MARSRIHAIFIITAIGAAVVITALLLLHFGHKGRAVGAPQQESVYNHILIAGNLSIPVSIAATPAQQQQGLSGTSSLPADAGKLFVFSQPGDYGFWMKDMNYSLDFVWMDSALKVVAVTPDVTPDTYPEVFYPPQAVSYVLEVNAGFAAKNNLTVGEQLSL